MRTERSRGEAARSGEQVNEASRGTTAARSSTPLIVTGGVLIAWWLIGKVLLALVAGILAAIALSAFTDWLIVHGVPRRGLALALVVFGNAAALGATGWLLAPEISAQIDELWERRADLSPDDAQAREIVTAAVDALDVGQARVAWPDPATGDIVVDERAKRSILLRKQKRLLAML